MPSSGLSFGPPAPAGPTQRRQSRGTNGFVPTLGRLPTSTAGMSYLWRTLRRGPNHRSQQSKRDACGHIRDTKRPRFYCPVEDSNLSKFNSMPRPLRRLLRRDSSRSSPCESSARFCQKVLEMIAQRQLAPAHFGTVFPGGELRRFWATDCSRWLGVIDVNCNANPAEHDAAPSHLLLRITRRPGGEASPWEPGRVWPQSPSPTNGFSAFRPRPRP